MFVARQPMGRLGTAEEMAAVAVYFASDESDFTTGITISPTAGSRFDEREPTRGAGR